jgi:hypothetical protein
MRRVRKISLGLVIVVALMATIGCSKALDYFREKHPDPPAGAFPPRVGKMVVDDDERWQKNPNCTRADPLHCWGYYILPGGDNEVTRIHYYMQIYDSADEANARLEEYFRQRVDDHFEENTWEDGGEKVGKLLIKNTVRREEDFSYGFCAVAYTKGERFITISHGYECSAAKEFVKDLTN